MVADGTPRSVRRLAAGVGASHVFRFGSSIFAASRGSLAYELDPTSATARPVDLAGRSRRLSALPKVDPATGELHLVADGHPQAYVVVSPGAFTRRSYAIVDAPAHVSDFLTTPTHVVFGTKGFVGLAPRGGEPSVAWAAVAVDAFQLLRAEDDDDRVVVRCLTPALERWTLDASHGLIDREVVGHDRAR
jgi:hypothetical protein